MTTLAIAASFMRPTGTTVIACVALVLASCALGVVLGRWSNPPTAASPTPVEVQTQPQDLRPLIEEMKQEHETLLQVLRERSGASNPSSTQRESLAQPSDATERLAAAVERLNALLERPGTRLGGFSPALERWKGPGFPSLDALFERMEAISGAGDPEWPQKVSAELLRAHLAWTREDIFERYGAPTSLSAGDHGMSLIFTRSVQPDARESVTFVTSEGLITETYFH